MKDNIVSIIFLILALGLFVSTIVFTNDSIKEKVSSGMVLPFISVVSILLILVVVLWKKIIKS